MRTPYLLEDLGTHEEASFESKVIGGEENIYTHLHSAPRQLGDIISGARHQFFKKFRFFHDHDHAVGEAYHEFVESLKDGAAQEDDAYTGPLSGVDILTNVLKPFFQLGFTRPNDAVHVGTGFDAAVGDQPTVPSGRTCFKGVQRASRAMASCPIIWQSSM